MNFINPSRIRDLMMPAINKTMRQHKQNKQKKYIFMAKTQYLILKAQRTKIKKQPERKLQKNLILNYNEDGTCQ